MTQDTALELFRKWVDGYDSKKDAADALNISAPYLTHLYQGVRPLTDAILDTIGLVREISFKRKAG